MSGHLELDFNGEVGKNISIMNNTFGPVWFSMFSNWGGGYQGDVGNVLIAGNNQQLTPDAGLELGKESCQPPVNVYSPSGVLRSGYTITNNQFRVFGDVIDLAGVENANVSNNTLAEYASECNGTGDTAVRLTGSQNVWITNNTFTHEPNVLLADTPTQNGFLWNNSN